MRQNICTSILRKAFQIDKNVDFRGSNCFCDVAIRQVFAIDESLE